MDPTNTNPVQPQAPVSPVVPSGGVPADLGVAAPAGGAVVTTPTIGDAASQPISEMPTPVNPVINPGAMAGAAVLGAEQNVAANVPVPNMGQNIVPNVAALAADGIMVGATDPITMPNLPKAPDPVEQELSAPMTAAAPVPGSIGSAISVPATQAAPKNVAFNDPAGNSMANTAAPAKPGKKKMDQKSLIMLCIAAGIVVVALVITLIMTMNG